MVSPDCRCGKKWLFGRGKAGARFRFMRKNRCSDPSDLRRFISHVPLEVDPRLCHLHRRLLNLLRKIYSRPDPIAAGEGHGVVLVQFRDCHRRHVPGVLLTAVCAGCAAEPHGEAGGYPEENADHAATNEEARRTRAAAAGVAGASAVLSWRGGARINFRKLSIRKFTPGRKPALISLAH